MTVNLIIWMVGCQWIGPEFEHVVQLGEGFVGLLDRSSEGLLSRKRLIDRILSTFDKTIDKLLEDLERPIKSKAICNNKISNRNLQTIRKGGD